ncbi:MAG: hypothetical protein P4L99_14525 [Chthoniobacter sp.]|nr:hypothetical protein [Chthoniobacter sp.]
MNVIPFRASHPIAVAAEEHLRKMETDGYGELTVEREGKWVMAAFGAVKVQAENYDIALVRLAGEMLSDPGLGMVFLERMRGCIETAKKGVTVERRRQTN